MREISVAVLGLFFLGASTGIRRFISSGLQLVKDIHVLPKQ